MKHIYSSSSLVVKQNPETIPSTQELSLPDGKAIAELIDESEQKRQDDTQQSNRETLS